MDHSSPVDCGFSSESSFQNEAADPYDRTYSPGPPYSLSHFTQQKLSPSSSQKDVPSLPSTGTTNEISSRFPISQPATPTRQYVPSSAGFLSQTLEVLGKLEDGPTCIPPNSSYEYVSFRPYQYIFLFDLSESYHMKQNCILSYENLRFASLACDVIFVYKSGET